MLNFYGNPVSPYVAKVHYLLEEAGIPYKYHEVNLSDPRSKAELARVNPFGKVPAIELNGFALGESNAILRYLVDRYHANYLYPANLEDRAQVNMVTEFIQAHVNRWILPLVWNFSAAPRMVLVPDQAAIAEAQSKLPTGLLRLEQLLSGRTFLAGPEFTLADVVLLPVLAEHKAAQISLRDYPRLAAWYEHASARPAWKKTRDNIASRLAEYFAARR